MKCQNCQFESPDGMKYCGECGQEIESACLHCGFTNPANFKFCGNCGCGISSEKSSKIKIPSQHEEILIVEDQRAENTCYGLEGERKYVTVMFSDLTGYTEMSEKLDPEEVKEITSAIFGELTKIIEKYDGFIEKYNRLQTFWITRTYLNNLWNFYHLRYWHVITCFDRSGCCGVVSIYP